ncbi:MAG: RNA 2',3'-cyclic phosphodiesterase [Thermoplasmata archaeon]
MRAFVAIEIPAPDVGAGGRAAPEHLTLRFLGNTPSEQIPSIVDRLREVARAHAPFDLTIEGIGAFPSRASPRIVWLGVGAGGGPLGELANDVRRALTEEGTRRPEGPFVPHVTWFRVRSPAERRTALDLLEGRLVGPPPRSVRVNAFVLKESVLGPGGAVHRTLAELLLDAPSRSVPTSAARSSTNFRQR